jgi:dolichol-phosphate mannosyltransferase
LIPRFIGRLANFAFRLTRGIFPLSLISFLIVGSLGVLVHMSVLKTLMLTATESFRYANALAMIVAATFNYLMNNNSTYRETSLSGGRIFAGYAIYLSITSLGLGLSLLISGEIYDEIQMPLISALAGIVIGSLWNYFMSYNFVWKMLSRKHMPIKNQTNLS